MAPPEDIEPIGTYRESMNQNPLLRKSRVGKVLERGHTLPPDDFAFGLPNISRDNGAVGALSNWSNKKKQYPEGGLTRSKSFTTTRDFTLLNKAAVISGLVTAPDHSQYRATHNIVKVNRNSNSNASKGNKADGIRRIRPEQVYGTSTRPSTPVFDLLEHRYQERWLQNRRALEKSGSASSTNSRHKAGQIYETRTSLLRKCQPPVEEPQLWKISKFEKIPSHISTFRNKTSRSAAFGEHDYDALGRLGMKGHGAYVI